MGCGFNGEGHGLIVGCGFYIMARGVAVRGTAHQSVEGCDFWVWL